MTRRASSLPAIKHFPTRVDTTGSVTTYTAICRYTSTDKAEFIDPRNYKVANVLECCRDYDRLKSAEQWTQAIQMERE